jgi:hypothetical protein
MRPGFSAVTPEVAEICSLLLIGLSFLVWHAWRLFLLVWFGSHRHGQLVCEQHTLLGSIAVACFLSPKMSDEAQLWWTAVVIASPTFCTCLAIALERRRQSTGPHVTDFAFGYALLASLVLCALSLVGIVPLLSTMYVGTGGSGAVLCEMKSDRGAWCGERA